MNGFLPGNWPRYQFNRGWMGSFRETGPDTSSIEENGFLPGNWSRYQFNRG